MSQRALFSQDDDSKCSLTFVDIASGYCGNGVSAMVFDADHVREINTRPGLGNGTAIQVTMKRGEDGRIINQQFSREPLTTDHVNRVNGWLAAKAVFDFQDVQNVTKTRTLVFAHNYPEDQAEVLMAFDELVASCASGN